MKYDIVGGNTLVVTDEFGNSYSVPITTENRDFRKYIKDCEDNKRAPVDGIGAKHVKAARKALGIKNKDDKKDETK